MKRGTLYAIVLGAAALVAGWQLHSTPVAGVAAPDFTVYDPIHCPQLECVPGRVLAETDPRLSDAQRAELWTEHGLSLEFEWVEPDSGFTFHELSLEEPDLWARLRAAVGLHELPARELPRLVEQLTADPRITWAAPDALVLEWCEGSEWDLSARRFGVSLIDYTGSALTGGIAAWAKDQQLPAPYPDFEYYRSCVPNGTQVAWADELSGNAAFTTRCSTVYGTGQTAALADYQAAGSPSLAHVTVCIADTGVEIHHPDYADRLHPNAIDANFRNYRVAGVDERPSATQVVDDRGDVSAVGMPREAIKGSPASHGTEVAGVLARCTEGFTTGRGGVRILPASLKSGTTMAITGTKVKSPISSFVKLVACLHREFPVGEFQAAEDDAVKNTGDVRVVSISASVPKRYFSDAEWRIVASIAGKAAGSIAEDLRDNDRVYLFAAGNEAMGAPSRPGDVDYVLAVSASMAFDGAKAWSSPVTGEGSNLGAKCVSAPGYGIITSNLTGGPNLAYLAAGEVSGRENFSIPPRTQHWYTHTNSFGATSAATPQVAALAALLYAQEPARTYRQVIEVIKASTEGRTVSADWGEAQGIVDYQHALGW